MYIKGTGNRLNDRTEDVEARSPIERQRTGPDLPGFCVRTESLCKTFRIFVIVNDNQRRPTRKTTEARREGGAENVSRRRRMSRARNSPNRHRYGRRVVATTPPSQGIKRTERSVPSEKALPSVLSIAQHSVYPRPIRCVTDLRSFSSQLFFFPFRYSLSENTTTTVSQLARDSGITLR